MKKIAIIILIFLHSLIGQESENSRLNLDKKKLDRIIIANNILNTIKKIGLRPLLSKDDMLGWSYGFGLKFNKINNIDQQIQIGFMTGKVTNYFLEYDKFFKNRQFIQLKNKFSSSSQSSVENDYILSQKKISTHIVFKNQIRYQIDLKYNKLNYTNTFLNNLNISELKNLFLWSKETKLQNTYFRNNLDIIYSLAINDYNQKFNHNHTINILNRFTFNLLESMNSARFTIKNHIILNSSKDIPIFEKTYINSEDFVRGYPINLSDNFEILSNNNIKWNNVLLNSIQFEVPLSKTKIYNYELILFADHGIGSNNHKFKNKLRGFGVGIRFTNSKSGGADMCFGLNPYNGTKQFHFIANFKKM